MLTGRKMYWNTVRGEAEWMLSGSTNVKDLWGYDVHIWDKWADAEGELGPTYGFQLKKQWRKVARLIREEPHTRRALINLWAVDDIDKMALPPCYHTLQFYQTTEWINLTVSSRSSDAAVGLPYDIAVLAYLLHSMANETGLIPGMLTFNACNTHINIENEEAVEEYLDRDFVETLPLLVRTEIGYFLSEYTCHKPIKMIVKP